MGSLKLGQCNYTVIGKIGQGGNCEVYRIKSDQNAEMLALKVLQSTHNARRFRREFRSMSKLNHENIARVFDFGEYNGKPCYSMEFIAGGDMKEWLKEEIGVVSSGAGQMPQNMEEFQKIARMFIEICKPLSYIHSRKILHRDLKPANIMLTEHGIIKLMDFGLIKELDIIQESLTRTGTFVGTVAYMSPEQGMGRQLNPLSDLYSLGVILYESLSGRLPFMGSTIVEVLMKHISALPESLEKMNPYIPDILRDLTMKLLEKEPGNRIPSADKIMDCLTKYVGEDKAALLQTIDSEEHSDTETCMSDTIQALLIPGLIGRQSEKTVIHSAIKKLVHGTPGVISICGELGTGKSALAREAGTISRINGLSLLKGSCSEIERYPYSVFQEPLETIVTRIMHKDEKSGQDILGNSARILASICPAFLKLPWINVAGKPEPLEPEQNKLRTFDAVQSVLENMAKFNGTVVILEDLHWADDLSLELIHYLCRNMERDDRVKPSLLLLVTWRPEEMSKTGSHARFAKHMEKFLLYKRIHLLPFDKNEATSMIQAMLGSEDIDSGVIQEIFSDSGGNPLFIEEILKNYFDNGVLRKINNRWTYDLTTTKDSIPLITSESFVTGILSVPEKIREIVSQRLERLNDVTLKNLRIAAVIGPEFSFDQLQKISATDEDTLLDQIDHAMREEIIDEVKGYGGELFRFRQNMIRHVLYSQLSSRRAAVIHKRVAEYIEKKHGKQAIDQSEILAYHYDKAGIIDHAVMYYLCACANSILYSAQMTLQYASRLIDLSEKIDHSSTHKAVLKMHALKYLGRAHEMNGNSEESLNAFQALQDLAIKKNNILHQSIALMYIGCHYMAGGEYEKSLEKLSVASQLVLQRNLMVAEDVIPGDWDHMASHYTPDLDKLLATIMANLAQVYMYQGRFQNSLKTFDVISAKMKKIGYSTGLAMCKVYQGLNHFYLGEYSKALEFLEESVGFYEEMGVRYQVVRAMNNLGGIYLAMGNVVQAMEFFTRTLSIAREIGDLCAISAAQGNLGIIFEKRGLFRKAVASSDEALVISRKLGDRPGIVYYLINLSYAKLRSGDLGCIDGYIDEALKTSVNMGDRLLQVSAMELQAEYFMVMGDWRQSAPILRDVIKISKDTGLKSNKIKADSHLAWISTLEGNSNSVEIAEQLVAESERLGELETVLISRQRLAEIHLYLGNYDKARAMAAAGLGNAIKSDYVTYIWVFLACIGRSWYKQQQPERAVAPFKKVIHIFHDLQDQMTLHSAKLFFQQKLVYQLLMDIKAVSELCHQNQLLTMTGDLIGIIDDSKRRA